MVERWTRPLGNVFVDGVRAFATASGKTGTVTVTHWPARLRLIRLPIGTHRKGSSYQAQRSRRVTRGRRGRARSPSRLADPAVELDAIPPDKLNALIHDAIAELVDADAWEKEQLVEADERRVLERMAGGEW